jgi:hypothetical protein
MRLVSCTSALKSGSHSQRAGFTIRTIYLSGYSGVVREAEQHVLSPRLARCTTLRQDQGGSALEFIVRCRI